MTTPIVTTRFNASTWRENMEYRAKHNFVCIYPSPRKISEQIDYNSVLYVVEMNNTDNRIEGIGLIRNRLQNKRFKVYEENNYNRYCYIGRYYLDRDDIVASLSSSTWLTRLETLLFKGKGHFKRGTGMTTLTDKMLRNVELDVEKEIKHLFLKKYKNEELI